MGGIRYRLEALNSFADALRLLSESVPPDDARYTMMFRLTYGQSLQRVLPAEPFHETVKRAAKPVSVMFSAILSCGIRRYFHGLPL